MSGRFWQGLGARVGYAIGGVILGPGVMLAQRRRRTRRRSLAGWLSEKKYTRLTAPHGTVRWLVERTEDELVFSVEVHLDPRDEGSARVLVRYERLPDRVRLVFDRKHPPAEDPEIAKLAFEGPISKLDWRSVSIEPELLEANAEAPMNADEWEAFVRGATAMAAWLARHHRAGYR